MYASPQAHDAGLRSYRLCKIMYFSITIQIKLKIYFPVTIVTISPRSVEATFTVGWNDILLRFATSLLQ